MLDFMLIEEIYAKIWKKSLKSHQELNNKIRTRDVYLAIIYIKVTVETLNVVEIGQGKKTEKLFHAQEKLIQKAQEFEEESEKQRRKKITLVL